MKAIEFTVGEYKIIRDRFGNWSRTIPVKELSHPNSFKEYGLTPFEQTLAEAYAETLVVPNKP